MIFCICVASRIIQHVRHTILCDCTAGCGISDAHDGYDCSESVHCTSNYPRSSTIIIVICHDSQADHWPLVVISAVPMVPK